MAVNIKHRSQIIPNNVKKANSATNISKGIRGLILRCSMKIAAKDETAHKDISAPASTRSISKPSLRIRSAINMANGITIIAMNSICENNSCTIAIVPSLSIKSVAFENTPSCAFCLQAKATTPLPTHGVHPFRVQTGPNHHLAPLVSFEQEKRSRAQPDSVSPTMAAYHPPTPLFVWRTRKDSLEQSWETRIRTWASRSRVRHPAARRFPAAIIF